MIMERFVYTCDMALDLFSRASHAEQLATTHLSLQSSKNFKKIFLKLSARLLPVAVITKFRYIFNGNFMQAF